jgi:hypothetical protein
MQTNRELNFEYDAIYREWAAMGFPDRDGNGTHYDASALEAIVLPWMV